MYQKQFLVLTFINSFGPYMKLMRWTLLLPPFYKWRKWSTERLSNFPQGHAALERNRAGIQIHILSFRIINFYVVLRYEFDFQS